MTNSAPQQQREISHAALGEPGKISTIDREHGSGDRKRSIYPNLKLRIYMTGMRQNQLAKLVGINEAKLSRIVNGIRIPGQQVQLQIAQVLDCNAEWLFEQATVVKREQTAY